MLTSILTTMLCGRMKDRLLLLVDQWHSSIRKALHPANRLNSPLQDVGQRKRKFGVLFGCTFDYHIKKAI
ncbi:MAG: hypothetical protein JNM57_07440 [Cyclobacteriaceae bacterium]|nr:hypothetical protein [Cyclobacteriaceae bacterium]